MKGSRTGYQVFKAQRQQEATLLGQPVPPCTMKDFNDLANEDQQRFNRVATEEQAQVVLPLVEQQLKDGKTMPDLSLPDATLVGIAASPKAPAPEGADGASPPPPPAPEAPANQIPGPLIETVAKVALDYLKTFAPTVVKTPAPPAPTAGEPEATAPEASSAAVVSIKAQPDAALISSFANVLPGIGIAEDIHAAASRLEELLKGQKKRKRPAAKKAAATPAATAAGDDNKVTTDAGAESDAPAAKAKRKERKPSGKKAAAAAGAQQSADGDVTVVDGTEVNANDEALPVKRTRKEPAAKAAPARRPANRTLSAAEKKLCDALRESIQILAAEYGLRTNAIRSVMADVKGQLLPLKGTVGTGSTTATAVTVPESNNNSNSAPAVTLPGASPDPHVVPDAPVAPTGEAQVVSTATSAAAVGTTGEEQQAANTKPPSAAASPQKPGSPTGADSKDTMPDPVPVVVAACNAAIAEFEMTPSLQELFDEELLQPVAFACVKAINELEGFATPPQPQLTAKQKEIRLKSRQAALEKKKQKEAAKSEKDKERDAAKAEKERAAAAAVEAKAAERDAAQKEKLEAKEAEKVKKQAEREAAAKKREEEKQLLRNLGKKEAVNPATLLEDTAIAKPKPLGFVSYEKLPFLNDKDFDFAIHTWICVVSLPSTFQVQQFPFSLFLSVIQDDDENEVVGFMVNGMLEAIHRSGKKIAFTPATPSGSRVVTRGAQAASVASAANSFEKLKEFVLYATGAKERRAAELARKKAEREEEERRRREEEEEEEESDEDDDSEEDSGDEEDSSEDSSEESESSEEEGISPEEAAEKAARAALAAKKRKEAKEKKSARWQRMELDQLIAEADAEEGKIAADAAAQDDEEPADPLLAEVEDTLNEIKRMGRMASWLNLDVHDRIILLRYLASQAMETQVAMDAAQTIVTNCEGDQSTYEKKVKQLQDDAAKALRAIPKAAEDATEQRKKAIDKLEKGLNTAFNNLTGKADTDDNGARVRPLGMDRYRRMYWRFPLDRRIAVQTIDGTTDPNFLIVNPPAAKSNALYDDEESDTDATDKKKGGKKEEEEVQRRWGFIPPEHLQAFVDSLDERGRREALLKQTLQPLVGYLEKLQLGLEGGRMTRSRMKNNGYTNQYAVRF